MTVSLTVISAVSELSGSRNTQKVTVAGKCHELVALDSLMGIGGGAGRDLASTIWTGMGHGPDKVQVWKDQEGASHKQSS